MRCLKCTSIEDKVIDSRISKEGSTIRRRRECTECGFRFTTLEALVRDDMVVIKRDGRREEFDSEKLLRAVRHACHKRPVDAEQLGMLVDDVLDALESAYESEIPSAAIGDAVMARLRRIDQVAYVRFASVYKEFRDVTEFVDEIKGMKKDQARKED